MNYRDGGYKTVGRELSFTPTEMGGRDKGLAMFEVGGSGIKSFGVVLTQLLEVSAILKGTQNVSIL